MLVIPQDVTALALYYQHGVYYSIKLNEGETMKIKQNGQLVDVVVRNHSIKDTFGKVKAIAAALFIGMVLALIVQMLAQAIVNGRG